MKFIITRQPQVFWQPDYRISIYRVSRKTYRGVEIMRYQNFRMSENKKRITLHKVRERMVGYCISSLVERSKVVDVVFYAPDIENMYKLGVEKHVIENKKFHRRLKTYSVDQEMVNMGTHYDIHFDICSLPRALSTESTRGNRR